MREVTDAKRAQDRLLHDAVHDSLTGLLNHTTSKQQLQSAINAARLDGSGLCVAMVDIDHFKSVNDTYGHPMGDHVIRSLSWLLKQRVRKSDAVGRYGGEEFAIVLPSVDEEGAKVVANRVLKAVSGLGIVHSGSVSRGVVTVSIGVATIIPSAKSSEKELIQAADEALYRAKHGGRNRVECNTIAPSDP